jgi:hypothetical protein
MTMSEAARTRGVSRAAATDYARRHSLEFAKKHRSPDVKPETKERARQSALRRWADPNFRQCISQTHRDNWAAGVYDGGRFRGEKSLQYRRWRAKGMTREQAIEIMLKDGGK